MSFVIESINKADNEVVVVLKGDFCTAFSERLTNTDNPALNALGFFLRDAARILRGVPVENFPMIARQDIVHDESAYQDEESIRVA
jgi:hypothetical protein